MDSKKWSIGFGEHDSSIVVEYDHYPINGKISLYDCSINELRQLAELFLSVADNQDYLYKEMQILKKEIND